MQEKSKVRMAIEGIISGAIIFLMGEDDGVPPRATPLYTKEEKEEINFSIKRDLEKYPRRQSECD